MQLPRGLLPPDPLPPPACTAKAGAGRDWQCLVLQRLYQRKSFCGQVGVQQLSVIEKCAAVQRNQFRQQTTANKE